MVKKLISSLLIAITVMAVIPKGASAEWERYGTRYKYKEGDSYVTGWKYIDNDWYYFNSDGVIRSGWVNDNGNWYFCYAHGQMAHDTTIDGYYLNSDGAWTNGEITADQARKLILNVDSTYIASNPNYQLSTNYREYSEEDNLYFGTWNFPKEPMYEFFFDNGNDGLGGYLVGKESKCVYALYNQGNSNTYQIEGNKIKKTFKWMGVGSSYDWR
ncbi:hypothetical protein CBE01nite_09110 [Clostridium beijerinckii]|uniref:Cell wall-binding protein n=1 Tax=Clostridium beijerinckii TaxID=1520 RepID=A0AB74VJ01_CLOBE|nr:hypothetical protein [Clostridium beijerinckii]NRZ25377.1 hypothetical protein [Clostridium beijerinckii]NYB97893.1 hypothetical protein [Clostridium beijerinckii]OOM25875.1 putative cell wall binding repeat protein [Clostridium beijerinckii]QUN36144.1 cell wall-binding protein [Clostridium beijerinckii]SQB13156.1 cell wall binding repeat-containing protein [Clostridium beijerinckii]